MTRTLAVPKVRMAIVIFGLFAMVFTPSIAQQSASSSGAKTAKSSTNPVHEITLPQYPPDLPAGPNLEAFQKHCLLCHSARYVTMQPPFSRAVWEKEIKKMVDVYGAPITSSDQQQIVEYLVAIKGPAESK